MKVINCNMDNEDRILKNAFFWNMMGSMLMAFQSVAMLIILTRTVDISVSGIFSIAYADATLLLTIGKYGIRNFQISDIKNEYSFEDYRISRYISTIGMIIISILYTIIAGITNSYTVSKSLIIIVMCLFKAVDSIEDVYHGRLQQIGRLDIASKLLSYRMIVTLVFFTIIFLFTRNLLITLICVTVFTFVFFAFCNKKFLPTIEADSNKVTLHNTKKLLIGCFPLFLSSFLSLYIVNIPKYAIDSLLSDDLQAIYGFISMPVFVIGLLNSFIYNPILNKMSLDWSRRNYKLFLKQIVFELCCIIGITIVCLIGADFLGIPVLSLLYNTDLTNYKKDLLILLVGGGFLGLAGFLSVVITIIRLQKELMLGYIIVAIAGSFLAPVYIRTNGISGASFLYLFMMAIMVLIFALILAGGLLHDYRLSQKHKQQMH